MSPKRMYSIALLTQFKNSFFVKLLLALVIILSSLLKLKLYAFNGIDIFLITLFRVFIDFL